MQNDSYTLQNDTKMNEGKFYMLFFDYSDNTFHQKNTVDFIVERLRYYYHKNLILPLAANTYLVWEIASNYSIEFYIQQAIDELSDEMAIGLSDIRHFLIPVDLNNISKYIQPWLKEIEIMQQNKIS